MKRIGVIGAGAGGLCAARHILAAAGNIQPVVWEQSDRIGGTWVYNENTGQDKYGLPMHSSMYKNLKTNLPKEVMAFPDYPFPEGGKSYVGHKNVLSYLEDYSKHYNLNPYLKFNQHVNKVVPLQQENKQSWEITTTDLNENKTSTTLCDALFVCVGHNSVPHTPIINGIDSFKGLQVHSHDYREATPYQGMKVAVLGASSSGMDIALEIATVAQQVFLSHNLDVIPSKLPSNMSQVPGITHIKEDGVVFGDGGSFAEVDAIVYCTGYEYTYPFLTPSCGISVEERQVKPVYKHIINTNYPSLGFFGIPTITLPFAILHYQVIFFMASLTGKVKLPSKEAMDKDTDDEFKKLIAAGRPPRHFHRIGAAQWDYIADLTSLMGIPTIPANIQNMFDDVLESRRVGLVGYRNTNYRLTKDSFEKYV